MTKRTERSDVVMVSMPFVDVRWPSIGLGLLKATLAQTDLSSYIVHANLRFAEAIGLVQYQALLMTPTDHLLGEWCFAGELFPEYRARDDEYLDLVLEVQCQDFPAELEQRKDLVRWVREQTTSYLDDLTESIVAQRPRIVGCSSVFQQHCASLALLKRIQAASPETVTLMGGANCEGEMGLETLRAFPWIDCVVSGEADAIFADLCGLLADQGRCLDPVELPPGAITQASLLKAVAASDNMWPPRGMVQDLDSLPIPDYDSYFEALKASVLSDQIYPGLLAESSRGCWWGEKSHCSFCGLNGAGMRFRSKSAGRVLAELAELSQRYGVRRFQFVDNILAMSHVDSLLAELAAANDGYSLFYETKANLKRDQVRLLAEAGVSSIQPGIESLHDDVLRLIGKGNTALMNLELMKWARDYGVQISWNMLCGLPGEEDAWYAEMANWLPVIFHLEPPSGVVRVRYDRFSPYQMRPQDYGISLTPTRTYAYVYPLSNEALTGLAYSFEDTGRSTPLHRSVVDQPGQRALQAVVGQWNQHWSSSAPTLRVCDEGDCLRIFDTRPCAEASRRTVAGWQADIYRLCDTAQTPSSLVHKLRAGRGQEITWKEVEPAVESLRQARILLRLNGGFLALGVDGHNPRESRVDHWHPTG